MKSKKGVSLSIETVVIALIVVVVLVVVIIFFYKNGGSLFNSLSDRVNSAIAMSKDIPVLKP